MGDVGAGTGMLVVETIAKIRRAYFAQKKPIKAICREFRLSRKVVRKVIRSEATEFHYKRGRQPLPRIDPWREQLDAMLLLNEGKPGRERLTLIRIFEELRGLGYAGGYDSVRRYARSWRTGRGAATAEAFVPLSFAPGEAYQFEWSYEVVLINGTTVTVKVAHVRLCQSRVLFVRAYPRESQEMVFDAHNRAFAFFRGTCTRGIYDSMKTAVETVFIGKDRQFNRRFLRMCGHYLVEPTACTPAAGWEKGQVENQVGLVRERFFTPRLRVASYEELNAWLLDRCVAYPKAHQHPELTDCTIWQAFEAERPKLVPIAGPFDGFYGAQAAVSKTCLVRFDNNKYSVASRAVGRPVEIQAYADRIVIRQDGAIVGEHARRFGRGETIYDPWHYVPVLARKPRNGAPFKDWPLPASLERVRRRLKGSDDGDRQMVKVLSAALTDGLAAVEAACAEALAGGVHSADIILNILARRRDPPWPTAAWRWRSACRPSRRTRAACASRARCGRAVTPQSRRRHRPGLRRLPSAASRTLDGRCRNRTGRDHRTPAASVSSVCSSCAILQRNSSRSSTVCGVSLNRSPWRPRPRSIAGSLAVGWIPAAGSHKGVKQCG
jgi:transposase